MTKLQEQYEKETGLHSEYEIDDPRLPGYKRYTKAFTEWCMTRDEAREQEIERLKGRLEALENKVNKIIDYAEKELFHPANDEWDRGSHYELMLIKDHFTPRQEEERK